MKHKPPKAAPTVYLRYILMNVPGMVGFMLVLIIIRHFVSLPLWLFWGLVACWVIKDAVLFPFVRRAYESDEASVTGSMVGKRGTVKTRLDPSGYIQVRGELWRAKRVGDGPPLEVGRHVLVQHMEGLTLYVIPEDAEEKEFS